MHRADVYLGKELWKGKKCLLCKGSNNAPFGKVRVRFAERNALGVMDHDVTLESGVTVHNPMRVVPNGEGCELVFTLIRRPGMSDEEFARDKAAVENDLKTLKDLMERMPRS
jgi:hypothetical protein